MHPPPRLSRDALVAAFHSYGRPRDTWKVGAEFERHVLNRETGHPLGYPGEPGIAWLLQGISERGRWERIEERGNLIALALEDCTVTLEPGAQLELSGAPHLSLQPIADEAVAFTDLVDDLLAGTPWAQASVGFTPWADVDDIPFVPKGRYDQMGPHLAATGKLAHHMMKGTCATQASYDFRDEADCARKVQLVARLSPITTALFANSPLTQGQPNGWMSFRGHIWTETDPLRTGLPDAAGAFSFDAWVDYLLQVPLMFKYVHGDYLSGGGHTFADWMVEGALTLEDWDLHQTTVFPEVRVKRQIEVRGADAVPLDLAMGFCALFKGLLYDDEALDQALEESLRFADLETREARFHAACVGGLGGEVAGRRLADHAAPFVELAAAGLERISPDERALLRPVEALVEAGESPAAALLRAWQEDPSPAHLLQALHPNG